jgi:hypothetical protein
MEVAGAAPRRVATGPRDGAMRVARTCYDHLAGRLGVALADALAAQGAIELTADGGAVTERGEAVLRGLGVHATPRKGRLFCRPCLDWSERRPHVGGVLGAALCARCFELGWVRRREGGRTLEITPRRLARPAGAPRHRAGGRAPALTRRRDRSAPTGVNAPMQPTG